MPMHMSYTFLFSFCRKSSRGTSSSIW